MVTLVLGGARSGKSSFAERIAYKKGARNVLYLATAEAKDQEMMERIKKHQQSRPEGWQTIEEAYDLKKIFMSLSSGQVILLDCLTLYVSNIILRDNQEVSSVAEDRIKQDLIDVINITRKKDMDLIIVSNIVGSGVVPPSKIGRRFRDITGRVNQLIARSADEVYLCIAGLPIEIKEIGLKNLEKFSVKEGGS